MHSLTREQRATIIADEVIRRLGRTIGIANRTPRELIVAALVAALPVSEEEV